MILLLISRRHIGIYTAYICKFFYWFFQFIYATNNPFSENGDIVIGAMNANILISSDQKTISIFEYDSHIHIVFSGNILFALYSYGNDKNYRIAFEGNSPDSNKQINFPVISLTNPINSFGLEKSSTELHIAISVPAMKKSNSFIIVDIYDTPLPKEDLRRKGNNSIYKNYID